MLIQILATLGLTVLASPAFADDFVDKHNGDRTLTHTGGVASGSRSLSTRVAYFCCDDEDDKTGFAP